MGEDASGIHSEHPFATPVELREPARRLRGRFASPVTVWTAGGRERPLAGLTVSSTVVSVGEPSLVLGLIGETTDLFDAVRSTGSFVVHVLSESDATLADRFAGLRPSPGGMFSGLELEDTPHGPALAAVPERASCRVVDVVASGFQQLVRGEIESIELGDLDSPLVYFRGRYRRLAPRANPRG
jgi:3-hydroxy-9,10-secoandrosta-1,3,5(10)-triene-9,17-dione monooxygenase reductase component